MNPYQVPGPGAPSPGYEMFERVRTLRLAQDVNNARLAEIIDECVIVHGDHMVDAVFVSQETIDDAVEEKTAHLQNLLNETRDSVIEIRETLIAAFPVAQAMSDIHETLLLIEGAS